jgi:hypothetical protein
MAYDQFLRGDEVAPLSLGSPLASPSVSPGSSATPAPAESANDDASSASPPAVGPASAAQLAGTWTVSSGSVAGYRVREQLARLPAQSDAVGQARIDHRRGDDRRMAMSSRSRRSLRPTSRR